MIRITSGGGATSTAVQLTYEINEKLCKPYCVNSDFQPIVTKSWSIADTENSNGIYYYTIQCVFEVTYLPKSACSVCGQQTNTFIEKFVVSFPNANTPTIADLNGYTEPVYVCSTNCNKAQGVKNVGNLSINTGT